MSNIIDLNGRKIASVLKLEPKHMVHHLRALWVARLIGTDAFFLGTMALGLMQQANVNTAAIRHYEAQFTFTGAKGTAFAGPVSRDRFSFIMALQDLQRAGIINHYDEAELDKPDAALRHFTLDPRLGSDAKWNEYTLIYFRLPDQSAKEYGEALAEKFQAKMQECTTRIDIQL